MPYDNIRLEIQGGVATLTIERPKALNALNRSTLSELDAALRELAQNEEVRALIITGAGEKAFVAGADISEMAALTTAQARRFAALGHRVMHMIEALSVPSIAAVNGYALGGGWELAMACDLIFAAEPVDAAKAKEIGLVLEVLPPDKLLEHCRAVAAKIAARGPLAVAQAKRAIIFGVDADLRSANELERQAFAVLFGTEDQREGMRAFLEKRPPVFKSR